MGEQGSGTQNQPLIVSLSEAMVMAVKLIILVKNAMIQPNTGASFKSDP